MLSAARDPIVLAGPVLLSPLLPPILSPLLPPILSPLLPPILSQAPMLAATLRHLHTGPTRCSPSSWRISRPR